MIIRKKMALMVISGILISVVAGTLFIYDFIRDKVLATEVVNLQKMITTFTAVASQRFTESQPKLKELARLLEMQLSKPIEKGEINRFHQLMERNPDGVWRNRKPAFNGHVESGVFLPPNSNESDMQKIQHLRIKQVMDTFGAAASKRLENVWYLSPNRSEIIFDKNHPEFVFVQKADNDYTKTPWVMDVTPQLNPNKELRFTPPSYDSVIGVWMVSAIYPLYVNNEWIGSLGEDMSLTGLLEFMFQSEQFYSEMDHFLIDNQGNFVLAGSWQKERELSSEGFKTNFDNEPELVELFKSTLTREPQLLSDNIRVQNHLHVAIGMTLEPLGWRYYLLVPVDQIMASTQKLFLNILGMILLVVALNGVLVFTITGRTITTRIKTLTKSMNNYANNHSIRVAGKLSGHDEISQAAKAFDHMANEIEEQQFALQESRDQFAALVTNIPGITYRCALDKVWTMLFMSGLVEELTGYPASDFINNVIRTYASVIHPDDVAYVDDEVNNAVNQDLPYTIEYRIMRSTGEIRWVHERGRAINDKQGSFVFLDGFILDITERYEREQNLKNSERQLAASNADLLQFANVVAHHLQEPARQIANFAQQLQHDLADTIKDNEAVTLALHFIRRSALRQRALVRDIQIYLASIAPCAVVELVQVAGIIAKTIEFNAPLIRETQAHIEYAQLPAVVIDRPRLYDIFNILLNNSLRYRQSDRPLRIHIYGKSKGDRVYYYFEDNGIGIPVEYRERVFLVFERLHISENQDSTGIGLATVRRIVENCNGSVYLKETKGGGTTVVFDLPAR